MYIYEISQCDCWLNIDVIPNHHTDKEIDDYLKKNRDIYNWSINDCYKLGVMKTAADNVKKALSMWLKSHCNISFFNNKVRYIDNDDCIYIVSIDDYKPLFIAELINND